MEPKPCFVGCYIQPTIHAKMSEVLDSEHWTLSAYVRALIVYDLMDRKKLSEADIRSIVSGEVMRHVQKIAAAKVPEPA